MHGECLQEALALLGDSQPNIVPHAILQPDKLSGNRLMLQTCWKAICSLKPIIAFWKVSLIVDPSPMLLQKCLKLIWVVNLLQTPNVWCPKQDLRQDARASLLPVYAPLWACAVQLICMLVRLQ